MEIQKTNAEVVLYQHTNQICELFQKVKSTISYHISNIFKEGELDECVVVRKSRTTTMVFN